MATKIFCILGKCLLQEISLPVCEMLFIKGLRCTLNVQREKVTKYLLLSLWSLLFNLQHIWFFYPVIEHRFPLYILEFSHYISWLDNKVKTTLIPFWLIFAYFLFQNVIYTYYIELPILTFWQIDKLKVETVSIRHNNSELHKSVSQLKYSFEHSFFVLDCVILNSSLSVYMYTSVFKNIAAFRKFIYMQFFLSEKAYAYLTIILQNSCLEITKIWFIKKRVDKGWIATVKDFESWGSKRTLDAVGPMAFIYDHFICLRERWNCFLFWSTANHFSLHTPTASVWLAALLPYWRKNTALSFSRRLMVKDPRIHWLPKISLKPGEICFVMVLWGASRL